MGTIAKVSLPLKLKLNHISPVKDLHVPRVLVFLPREVELITGSGIDVILNTKLNTS